MSTPASSRGWGSGWPRCQTSRVRTLARRDGLRCPLRAEILDLVAMLLDVTELRGYDVRVGQTWGYACRDIKDARTGRGTGVASNHSWGLAVDINAPSNPRTRPLTTDMPGWMVALWEAHGFEWGGWWSTPDPMHFEFAGTPADAARHTARLRAFLTQPPPASSQEDIMASLVDLETVVRKVLTEGAGKGQTSWANTSKAILASVQGHTNRLADIEARLAAIEAKLDALATEG